jgi:multiple sugar transport system permease protein
MSRSDRIAAWTDRASPSVFVMPAVLVVLALSIFPLVVSLYLSLARVKFEKGGVSINFVGLLNYKKLLFGSQQFHLLGKLVPISPVGWLFVALRSWASSGVASLRSRLPLWHCWWRRRRALADSSARSA